jgi:6-pyruvoyltetrahydropterin/6-carboxytetrahydropterin synthase
VSKEFQWAMAHMLDGHEGLCQNLHGHEYKLIVTVTSKDADINDKRRIPAPVIGMVVDFKELKSVVNRLIVNKLDHTLMLNGYTKDAFEQGLINLADECHKKHEVVDYRPTAENMVQDFAEQLQEAFEPTRIRLVRLRLYETPTSYAEWEDK